MTERWWHLIAGVCPHGIYTSMLLGDGPTHPEELAAQRNVPLTIETIACEDGCETVLDYVRSWNHEPSDTEVDAVTPDAHKD